MAAEETSGARPWLARWAGEPFAYLTTIGRRTGRRHRIEIWFGVDDGRLYLLAGGRERADWVRNVQAESAGHRRVGRRDARWRGPDRAGRHGRRSARPRAAGRQ